MIVQMRKTRRYQPANGTAIFQQTKRQTIELPRNAQARWPAFGRDDEFEGDGYYAKSPAIESRDEIGAEVPMMKVGNRMDRSSRVRIACPRDCIEDDGLSGVFVVGPAVPVGCYYKGRAQWKISEIQPFVLMVIMIADVSLQAGFSILSYYMTKEN